MPRLYDDLKVAERSVFSNPISPGDADAGSKNGPPPATAGKPKTEGVTTFDGVDLNDIPGLGRMRGISPTLISKDGRTCTAASQKESPCENVFDGDTKTIWHSQFKPNLAPLPHEITIDMKKSYTVGMITIVPRQDGYQNGNTGRHVISLSSDGKTFVTVAHGTFLDDASYNKITNIVPTNARYLKIQALSEAGNRGPWTSIAEVTVNKATQDLPPKPSEGKGAWGPTVNFPLIAVSMANVYSNQGILAWYSYNPNTFGGTDGKTTATALFKTDVLTIEPIKVTNIQHDMFCEGLSLDFNGIGISTGGNTGPATSIYGPGGWTKGPAGFVFQAGPSKAMNWYDTTGTGSQAGAGNRAADGHAMCGTAAMYDATAGKILTAGGSPDYQNSDATSNAHVITIDRVNEHPTVQKITNMAYQRTFHNSVILPDGTVFIVGGQITAKPFNDDASQLTPELFDPATNAFTQMAPMQVPRNYHSTALLLADATVISAGSGLCGRCSTNHYDAQIFRPPYLFNAAGAPATRPVITALSSDKVALGGTFIAITNGKVKEFSIVRLGSTTHTVNTDQRRIPLKPTADMGNTYTLALPNDAGVALPGYWFLFAIDAAGVPSVARTIKMTP
ncbi:uncharacterized protein KY384_009269 [Bacidia gigantensis]|uniref:uncharacterized protein n=1 Tax=Bacidia gigantensis TaxID=2732470 RepID=UPI001D04C7DA|nr:uncharacterized protein KY384_009269 [Bacidia gigantensis]KAG8525625.1 hypothetical protein KY384_009269 [Bacidia gigantensis]